MKQLEEFAVGQIWKFADGKYKEIDEPANYVILVDISDADTSSEPLIFEMLASEEPRGLPYSRKVIREKFQRIS